MHDYSGSASRDDLIMKDKESSEWYKNVISLEEKVDGSNLGISINADNRFLFQNRSHYVTTATQRQVK